MKFNEKLVLNSYIFSLLGVKNLEELSKSFKDELINIYEQVLILRRCLEIKK